MVMTTEVVASVRAREALPSPVRMLMPLANRAIAEGVKIYHLNIGQPDLPTPPAIMDRIHDFTGMQLAYAPSQGLSETVDAWRTYYGNVGLEVETDDLLVTSGGSEAILFALMAVADPGDEIIVFDPSYANYFGFARMACVNPVPVVTRAEDGFHLPSAIEIESKITSRTRAILFASPGNPTGTLYSYDELDILSEIAVRHGLFLISDETYREIVYNGPRNMSTLKIARSADQTIVVDSVSKRFSATGARIGCVICRHAAAMEGMNRFAQARLSSPSVEQYAVVPLLQNSHSYTTELAAEYRRRRDTVCGTLQDMRGVYSRPPEGAFYIQAVLPIDDGVRFASWLLSDFRSGSETVMIAPGDGFYATPGLGKREARIAFVLDATSLHRAMMILNEALVAYPGAQA
jgi:aspartate aminotransferase